MCSHKHARRPKRKDRTACIRHAVPAFESVVRRQLYGASQVFVEIDSGMYLPRRT